MGFRKRLCQMYKNQRWDCSRWWGIGFGGETQSGDGKGGAGGGDPGEGFYWKVLRRFSHKRVEWPWAGVAGGWQGPRRQRPEVRRGSPGDPRSPPGEGSGAGSAPPCPAGRLSPAAGSQRERFCAIEREKAGVPLWKNRTIRPTVH